MKTTQNFDVIIIGGSYAGLSAAMSLGRSLRNVLIIDSGLPCNRQTPHSHNFITQDGVAPQRIAALAKEQVLAYPTIQFLNGLAIKAEKTATGFTLTTEAGGTFTARKLVLATGIKDIMPDIKGFSECWGITVVHCPYCHGYEVRQQKTAIMANGDRAFHLATMVRNLTDDLTILTNGKPDFSSEQSHKLDAHNITLIDKEISEITHHNGQIQTLVFRDGSRQDFQAMYAALPFVQHSDIAETLGCGLTEVGYLKVDDFHQTTIEGVYACGDNTAMMRSVANAVSGGNLTGAMINKILIDEQF